MLGWLGEAESRMGVLAAASRPGPWERVAVHLDAAGEGREEMGLPWAHSRSLKA